MIELLIVISIIGVLAATLIGPLTGVQWATNVAADEAQLRTHGTWLTLYERKHKNALPQASGHKFVLSTWTSGIFHHDEENLDLYFSLGVRNNDPDYRLAASRWNSARIHGRRWRACRRSRRTTWGVLAKTC